MLSKKIFGRVLGFCGALLLALSLLIGLGWMLAGMKTVSAASLETAVATSPTSEVCFVSLNNNGTTDFLSSDGYAVQEAVNAATDGDLLRVAGWCDSTFITNGLTQTVYISKSLTIQGGYDDQDWGAGSDPVANPTTLVAWDGGRVIVVDGTDLNVTLEGLTIQRGNAGDGTLGDNGGGIWNNGTLTLTTTILKDNHADEDGGAIYNDAGILSINNSYFEANSSSASGGGVFNLRGQANIDTSTFYTNSAIVGGAYNSWMAIGSIQNSTLITNSSTDLGGALRVGNSTLTMTHSLVQGNVAGQHGGGIYANAGAQLTFENITMRENRAYESGGGIYAIEEVSLTIQNSDIVSNSAQTERGGGIYINNRVTANIQNSTISHNQAAGENGTASDRGNGGGLYLGGVQPSVATVTHSTITHNYAAGEGGGMDFNRFAPGDILTFAATILAGNTAGGTHQDCFDYNTGNYTFNTADHNLFSGAPGDDCPLGVTDLSLVGLGQTINAIVEPNLVDNGGDTLTHALLPGSVAIDYVPPELCSVTIDQRGVVRPQNTNCDIGSFEAAPTPLCFVETNGDGLTDYGSVDASALQTAVNAASSSDLLKIAGTCAGVNITNNLTQTVYISKSLTLQGGYTNTNWLTAPDSDIYTTTLDALDQGRVAVVLDDNNVTLENLLFTGGKADDGAFFDDGGGIYSEAWLTVTHSTISGNNAKVGGGIVQRGRTLNLLDSTIMHNTSDASGGGLGNRGGGVIVNIQNSLFYSNTAGVVFANQSGGGLWFSAGTLTLTNSIVQENVATRGGGIYANSQFFMSGTTVHGNTATIRGGGIYGAEAFITLENSTVSGNSSPSGSGLGFDSGLISMTHMTVSDNDLVGMYIDGGTTVEMANSIIANNTNADCINNDTFTDNGYNLVEDGSCLTDPTSISGDPNLGVLANNGGDTQTHALLPSSPAIDHIPAGFCTLLTDQRDVTRPQNTNCDIGAYEVWRINIAVATPSELTLTWGEVADSCTYDVYEETMPYITPTTITYPGQSSGVVYPRLGDVGTNYFYVVEAVCGGVVTAVSNQVGEFDFAITPGD